MFQTRPPRMMIRPRHLVARVLLIAACLLMSRVAAAQTGETVEYYGLDALGSVRVVFDAAGNVTGRMDYGPFGESLATGSGMPSRAYAGLFRDGEAGLDHAEARSYQLRTGRFSTVDAVYAGIFEPQRWNRYAYALNSPFVRIDPTGNADCQVGSYWCPGNTGPPPIDLGFHETVTVTATTPHSSPSGFSLATAIAFALASIATQPSALPGYTGPNWGHILATRTFPGMVVSAAATAVSSESSSGERVLAAANLALLVVPGAAVKSAVPELRISASKFPELAKNILNAQRAGFPQILTHGGDIAANRAAALEGIPYIRGLSRDEYPFASSMQGGAGSWVGHIPAAQQNAQGALLTNFIRANSIAPGSPYRVVIVP